MLLEEIKKNHRLIILYVVIWILGCGLTVISILTDNPHLLFLGMSPLMALFPFVLGWMLFLEWVMDGFDKKDNE